MNTLDIEFCSKKEIKKFQEGLLNKALTHLNNNSPYYKRIFREKNIDIHAIKHLEDLQIIPFTEKKDFQLYNNEFLCCPKEKIVDYVTTSGTLGEPVTFCCSDSDLERLALNEKKSFERTGLGPGNIIQLMTTIDKRFMAGLAYFLGIRKMGASIIRVGNGIPELQWDTIERMHPDALMCIPSFILKLIEYAENNGIDYRNSSIKKIIGVGEGIRDQNFNLNILGKKIKEKWDVELYSTYSSTEMGATFSECQYGMGGHVAPELIIIEIVDEQGNIVPDGVPGEVVATTLGVEAMPILRFKTGDIAAKITEQCKCGRNSYRLTPLIGRKNNMIKLKGTTIYPPALNEVLDNCDFVANYVVEVRDSSTGTDEVLVRIGLSNGIEERDAIDILKDHFRSRLRVTPLIEVRDKEEINRINFPAKSRKPIKFIDKRNRGL